MAMNEAEYRSFYDRVGHLNGWNFSKVKCVMEGATFQLYEEVRKVCKQSDLLLDIGTGGGEALLQMSDAVLLLIGIDVSANMIGTANTNRKQANMANVRYMQMDASNLEFPEHFFDVVSCRQAPFYADQVAKVLSPDGVFLTQQVGEGDKENLKRAFGRGQGDQDSYGQLKNKYLDDLTQAGFKEIHSYEYDASEYYESAEDLIFLLKHTPIIPDFGRDAQDFHILDSFIQENRTDQGIRTNAKRFMIIARR
jgi:ubiquinone/menaquinone biosynthesis C-methylase UbiE